MSPFVNRLLVHLKDCLPSVISGMGRDFRLQLYRQGQKLSTAGDDAVVNGIEEVADALISRKLPLSVLMRLIPIFVTVLEGFKNNLPDAIKEYENSIQPENSIERIQKELERKFGVGNVRMSHRPSPAPVLCDPSGGIPIPSELVGPLLAWIEEQKAAMQATDMPDVNQFSDLPIHEQIGEPSTEKKPDPAFDFAGTFRRTEQQMRDSWHGILPRSFFRR